MQAMLLRTRQRSPHWKEKASRTRRTRRSIEARQANAQLLGTGSRTMERRRCQRKQALERDGHQCCECGSRKYLQVHHKKDIDETRGVWDNSIGNLETLCGGCHLATHRKKWHDAICPICSRVHRARSTRACCSKKCRREVLKRAWTKFNRKQTAIYTCHECRKQFTLAGGRWKYCSRECLRRARTKEQAERRKRAAS